MAEEHGFRASEGHTLCLNNCGFFGSPATQNFCSKCYTDLFINQEVKSAAITTTVQMVTVELDPQVSLPSSSSSSVTSSPATATPTSTSFVDSLPAAQPNRCSCCRKKVGLTGFRCRCGVTFCGTHRYPEQHGCNFDFKTIGREAIAKANPVVKGKKLEKI